MLREDLDAPRKQRHTARRVLDRLVDEHELRGVVFDGARLCRASGGPEIAAEAGRAVERRVRAADAPSRAPRPRSISPICGSICAGCGRRCSCSRCGCLLGAGGAQGVRHAGSGGVPRRASARVHRARRGAVRQDPLRQPEIGGIAGAVRPQPHRVGSVGAVSVPHAGFDAFYCQPGVDGAHEKGGVEGEGRPVPAQPSGPGAEGRQSWPSSTPGWLRRGPSR